MYEGSLNMGSQAITSDAGTIRDASGGWVRTYGNTGWYNGTHGGGWYMTDGTYVRTYNGKSVMAAGYFHSSDERLKENIETSGGLDVISKLHGVTYNWKKDGKASAGVIAQEIEKILPAAVATDNDGMKSVEYDQIIAPLIEAVKELKAENDALKTRLDKLEQK